jgi:hypothetical protein
MAEMTRDNQSDYKASNRTSPLDAFLSLKREAYATLDQALSIDSNANTVVNRDAAIVLYETSLTTIERALAFYKQNDAKLSESSEAVKLQSQLVKMRTQANDRLNLLKNEKFQSTTKSGATNNSSTIRSNNRTASNEFLDLGDEILDNNDFLIIDDSAFNDRLQTNSNRTRTNEFEKATELISFDDGVKIFYIANDGSVSTESTLTTLSIYSFDE